MQLNEDTNYETMSLDEIQAVLYQLQDERNKIREEMKRITVIRDRRVLEAEVRAKVERMSPEEKALLARQLMTPATDLTRG